MIDKLKSLKENIREVPDFPKKGILFRDITTLLKDPILLSNALDLLVEPFKNCGITKVVGLESRGFIFGSLIAHKLNAGFVLVRKKGKLPAVTISQNYTLEYGNDALEMHIDAISPNDIVLLHDDLIATGGSALAVVSMLKKLNVKKIYASFLCELVDLHGKEKLQGLEQIETVLQF
ncbi:MAG: adenine phosphoribosyltransferase [Bacteroidales bacterium]|jgi:adenine phosphoribosyltransferase|nr:adenine phosphoribosyltransferase [Bacteroidales bacterium]